MLPGQPTSVRIFPFRNRLASTKARQMEGGLDLTLMVRGLYCRSKPGSTYYTYSANKLEQAAEPYWEELRVKNG